MYIGQHYSTNLISSRNTVVVRDSGSGSGKKFEKKEPVLPYRVPIFSPIPLLVLHLLISNTKGKELQEYLKLFPNLPYLEA